MQFEHCQCGHGLAGFEGSTYQLGHGLTGFEGLRFQKGHGLWANILKFVKPAIRWIGKRLFEAGTGVASDVLAGETIKESASKRLKATAKQVVDKTAEKAHHFAEKGLENAIMKFTKQKGSGKKNVKCIRRKKAGRPRKVGRPCKNAKSRRKSVKGKIPKRRRRRTTEQAFDFLQ